MKKGRTWREPNQPPHTIINSETSISSSSGMEKKSLGDIDMELYESVCAVHFIKCNGHNNKTKTKKLVLLMHGCELLHECA